MILTITKIRGKSKGDGGRLNFGVVDSYQPTILDERWGETGVKRPGSSRHVRLDHLNTKSSSIGFKWRYRKHYNERTRL